MKRRRALFFALLLLLPIFSYARGGKVFYRQINPEIEPPWLTGPLIAPAARVVPVGHYNVQPYIYVTDYSGQYNADWDAIDFNHSFWNAQLQIPLQIGCTEWMTFVLNPILNWNYCNHKGAWRLGDLPFGFDFQLYYSPQDSAVPNVKLSLRENIPTGKYRNLNPNPFPKYLADGGGVGTWATNVGLVFGNLYHIASVYYFDYRLLLNYTYSAPVHIKGFNYYGGGFGTNGRYFSGPSFQADLGLEFTLSQTWAVALDAIWTWSGKSSFTGTPGTTFEQRAPAIAGPSGVQYSLAPAIEYNPNANFGIVAGAWFTPAGKNSLEFVSSIIAFNYYK